MTQEDYEQLCRRAAHAVDEMPDANDWSRVLVDWYARGASESIAALVSREAPLLDPALATALDEFVEHRGRRDIRVAVLVGRALANVVFPTCDVLAFDKAQRFVFDAHDDLGSFVATMVQRAKTDQERAVRWVAVISAAATDLGTYTKQSPAFQRTLHAMQEEEDEIRQGKLLKVWAHHANPESFDPSRAWSRMRFLLKLDPAAYLRAIEAVPLQALRNGIIDWLSARGDIEVLDALFAASPSFWLETGWSGAVTPLMIAERRLSLEKRRRTAPDADKQATLEALRSFFEPLRQRADGFKLAETIIVFTVPRATRAELSGGAEWTPETLAGDVLARILLERGASPATFRTRWSADIASGHRSGVPYLLAASNVWAERDFSGDNKIERRDDKWREELWAWYRELLIACDEDIGLQVNPYGGAASWVFHALGLMLALADNPSAEFAATWGALAGQRFRARMTANHDATSPSYHFVSTAQHSLDWLVGATAIGVASVRKAEELWMTLWRIKGEFLGSLPHYSRTRDLDLLAWMFAAMPHVLRERWTHVAETAMPILRSDPVIAIRAAFALASNGVSARDVLAMFRRFDVDLLTATRTLATLRDRCDLHDDVVLGAIASGEELQKMSSS